MAPSPFATFGAAGSGGSFASAGSSGGGFGGFGAIKPLADGGTGFGSKFSNPLLKTGGFSGFGSTGGGASAAGGGTGKATRYVRGISKGCKFGQPPHNIDVTQHENSAVHKQRDLPAHIQLVVSCSSRRCGVA